jgi:aldehyde dehydrogenase (NAD+)
MEGSDVISALLFSQRVPDAGLPPGVFNLVNGSGPEVRAAIAVVPDIDKTSITGSNRAGALIAQAVAHPMEPVTQRC